MVPKLCQKVPKWSQNGSKLVLKLSQNSPKIFQVIDLEVINLNSEFEPCSSLNGWDKLLVQFLATMEAVAPLANDPIMVERLILSFRDLEHQNPSIISDSIDRGRMWEHFQNKATDERKIRTEYSSISWYLIEYNAIWYNTKKYNRLPCNITMYYTLHYNSVQYCVLWISYVDYNTLW